MPDVQYKHPRYSRRIQSKSDPPYGDFEVAKPITIEPNTAAPSRRVSAPHANRTSPLPKPKPKEAASRVVSGALPEVKEDIDKADKERVNDENEPPAHVGDGKATGTRARRGRGWLRGRRGRASGSRTPSATIGTN